MEGLLEGMIELPGMGARVVPLKGIGVRVSWSLVRRIRTFLTGTKRVASGVVTIFIRSFGSFGVHWFFIVSLVTSVHQFIDFFNGGESHLPRVWSATRYEGFN